MSYEPEADANKGLFSGMPGKKMALLVGIIIIGGFFGLQALFGFPIKDVIRSDESCYKIRGNLCCNRTRPAS
jgi:hypothetical protein